MYYAEIASSFERQLICELGPGLERRVEGEAEQMLRLQVDKDEEIENLKAVLLDKQSKIMVRLPNPLLPAQLQC